MAPLPVVPKVLQVALTGGITFAGPAVTRFYVQYTGTAPTAAQLATFNAALATSWNTNLKTLADTDYTLLQIESIDLSSASGAVAITAESIVGTRTGLLLPADVSLVASYSIARRYRGGHPRGYWRFGTATDVGTPRNWGATFITNVTTGLTAFFNDVVAAGWTGAGTLTHVNVSYFSGFTVVTNPITGRARNVPKLRVAPTVDQVTGFVPRRGFGTQRRRLEFLE